MELKLELVQVPVSDVDLAVTFYTEALGFNLDVDVTPMDGMRVVQLTPPGSACSILIGTGMGESSSMPPGTQKALHLVVDDMDAARQELVDRGVDVAEVVDVGGGVKYAWFGDPDGNSLALQEMPWRTGANY